MRYRSTRGGSPDVDFETAILTGLAPDGGLYLPFEWPSISEEALAGWNGLSYQGVAARVIEPFAAGFLDLDQLEPLVAAAYEGFGDRDIAPIVDLGDMHLMELFWGPTLAFKDFGLQVLASMVDVALQRRDRKATVVGATSGDTGSAAIEAFRDREQVDVVILYPHGRVSEVQRRQMTTVQSSNVHAVAVEGTFDDCQELLKRLLADETARRDFSLTTANSINFGRLAPQIAYYIWAVVKFGSGVSFAVPSGNFGNVFSGHAARTMTRSIDTLIVGANRNRVLVEFVESGELSLGEVFQTVAPSMDIQIPSNLERLLFELYAHDGAALSEALGELANSGRLIVSAELAGFEGYWFTDDQIAGVMAETYADFGTVLDPHTAIGVGAARDSGIRGEIVALATAHPAKFPDVVASAIGHSPKLPAHLADLFDRPERVSTIANDLDEFRALVAAVAE